MSSARNALLESPLLSDAEKRLLKRISLRIDPHDDMFVSSNGRDYLGVGLSAMRCIDRAVRRTQTNVRRILDLPSGRGRVLRFLRVAFDKAEITACEIDPNAVRFCERTFGVTGVRSTPEFSKLAFPMQFDLIWCGSLVTHLDQQHTTELLRCFWRHLAPGGLCLLTTHGPMTGLETNYGLSVRGRVKMLGEFAECEYGYADYDGQSGYGISVISFMRMTKIASETGNWSLAVFLERGWDNHQDVYGFFKPQAGRTAEPADCEWYDPRKTRKYTWPHRFYVS